MAERQARNPTLRGVTLWVETDGTVYWATPETAITTHGDGANRNDNKYIDNSTTHGQVTRVNSIGIEFVGNFPDVRKPPTPEQSAAWLVFVRFLQERYGIAPGRIYAHNWIDYKDSRYCEGCDWRRPPERKITCRAPMGRGVANRKASRALKLRRPASIDTSLGARKAKTCAAMPARLA